MLRLYQLTLTPEQYALLDQKKLTDFCCRRLYLRPEVVKRIVVSRKSIDARHDSVSINLTCDIDLYPDEQKTLKRRGFKPNVCAYFPSRACDKTPMVSNLPMEPWSHPDRPVVVGMGPAGLFCAFALALRGAKPIVIERGESVDRRTACIKLLNQTGEVDPCSNVLFGEGGAGTFSDGKLTCGLNDPLMASIVESFIKCGAPEEIRVQKRPHIGTDKLRGVIRNLRQHIAGLEGDIWHKTTLTGLVQRDGVLSAILLTRNGYTKEFPCRHLFLCTGHSARDTYRMLKDCGVQLAQKPFAVGVRVEHLRESIDRVQYGRYAGKLPAAEYKLNVHTPDGRGIYTFCMCPGGRVINASHDAEHVNVNGMSLYARNDVNSNAALLCGVSPADFGSDDPLAGLLFQQRIESAAYRASGGRTLPVSQTVGDFLAQKDTISFAEVQPSFLPGVTPGNLDSILPAFVAENLRYALPLLGAQLMGFDDPGAVLTGPETRSSSPVRILRNERFESSLPGLYPLGEGAGYAGGIMSSALDGLKAGMCL